MMRFSLSTLILLAMAAGTRGAPPGPPTPTPRLSDFETVRRAVRFSTGPIGFGGETAPAEAAFRKLLRTPGAARDCRNLLADGTHAGQLYGLLGLKLLKDPAYSVLLPRYKASRNQVAFAAGCVFYSRPVADVVRQIDADELR